MYESLAHGNWMQHSRDLPLGCLPDGGNILNRIAALAILYEMPAPVVKPGDVPGSFPPVVEEEHFAQEIPNAPKVIFTLN